MPWSEKSFNVQSLTVSNIYSMPKKLNSVNEFPSKWMSSDPIDLWLKITLRVGDPLQTGEIRF